MKELVDDGLLERAPYREPGQRTRHGYRLTEKGADLLPVLVSLKQWGDRWLGQAGVEIGRCWNATSRNFSHMRRNDPARHKGRPILWFR